MAFEMNGPHISATIDGEHEALFDLPQVLGIQAPQINRLWDRFYADPKLTSSDQVKQLRNESVAVKDAYAEKRGEAIEREKHITVADDTIRRSIIDQFLKRDPLLQKLEEIIAVCDDAISSGKGIDCSSD